MNPHAEGVPRFVPIVWEPLERESLPSIPDAEQAPDERPLDIRLAERFATSREVMGWAGCLLGLAAFIAAPLVIVGMMIPSQIATRYLIGITSTEKPDTLFECLALVVGTVWPVAAMLGALGWFDWSQKRAERMRLERRLAERGASAAILSDPVAQLGLSEDDLDRLFAFQHRGDRWLLLARKDDVPRVARSDDREGLAAAYSLASLRQRERGIVGEHQRSMTLLWRRERPIWPGSDEDGERRNHECRELPPFDAIRLRARSATPGDWRFVPSADRSGAIELRAFRTPGANDGSVRNGDSVGARIFTSQAEAWGENAEANREFLVRARAEIEWMLKELEQESAPQSIQDSDLPGLLVAADFLEEKDEGRGALALRQLARHGYVETRDARARSIENRRQDSAIYSNAFKERRLAGIRALVRTTTRGDWVWETRFGGGGYFLVARETETPGFRQDSGAEAFIRRSGPPRPEDRPPPSVPLVFIPFDDWSDDDQNEDDRRFIAHARSDALRLSEELSALRWPTWTEDDKQELLRSAGLLEETGFVQEGRLLRSLAETGVASVGRDEDSISEP